MTPRRGRTGKVLPSRAATFPDQGPAATITCPAKTLPWVVRTPLRRPSGQLEEGRFGPTREMDYEVELGAFLGPGNTMGNPIPVQEAQRSFSA